MRKINFLLLLLLSAVCVQMQAQERYLDEVFTDVQVTTGITYGVNASILAYQVFGEAIPENLLMDIYEPVGDTETSRPLVIYCHSGNFLPFPDNGTSNGTRQDCTIVDICKRLARMGYVAASIDYRLGWNPVAPTQDERVNTLINAAYRGVQDARTAVRYFRKDAAENGNTYGIDPNKTVIWGQGTGGYISFAVTTLDDYQEVLLPKFTTVDGGGNPIPMVIEQINGDIYGTSVGVNPLDGDTLCYPNHVGYNSDFQMGLNMGGALGDSSWAEDSNTPFVSFHTVDDQFAPYANGIVIVPLPGNPLPVLEVQGSYIVQRVLNRVGANDIFLSAGINDVYTTKANSMNDGSEGLYPMKTAEASDSGPWDWWDPTTNPNHSNAIQGNPDMSQAKATAYMDTIFGYFAPRACAALSLSCSTVGLEDLEEDLVELSVAPNPAKDVIALKTSGQYPIEDIYVYDMSGRLVKAHVKVNSNYFRVERNNLPSGMYMMQLRFKDGQISKRVMFE